MFNNSTSRFILSSIYKLDNVSCSSFTSITVNLSCISFFLFLVWLAWSLPENDSLPSADLDRHSIKHSAKGLPSAALNTGSIRKGPFTKCNLFGTQQSVCRVPRLTLGKHFPKKLKKKTRLACRSHHATLEAGAAWSVARAGSRRWAARIVPACGTIVVLPARPGRGRDHPSLPGLPPPPSLSCCLGATASKSRGAACPPCPGSRALALIGPPSRLPLPPPPRRVPPLPCRLLGPAGSRYTWAIWRPHLWAGHRAAAMHRAGHALTTHQPPHARLGGCTSRGPRCRSRMRRRGPRVGWPTTSQPSPSLTSSAMPQPLPSRKTQEREREERGRWKKHMMVGRVWDPRDFGWTNGRQSFGKKWINDVALDLMEADCLQCARLRHSRKGTVCRVPLCCTRQNIKTVIEIFLKKLSNKFKKK